MTPHLFAWHSRRPSTSLTRGTQNATTDRDEDKSMANCQTVRGNMGIQKEMLDFIWNYVRTDGSCQRTCSSIFTRLDKRPSSPSTPLPSFAMITGRFYLRGRASEERPPSGFSLSLGTLKQQQENDWSHCQRNCPGLFHTLALQKECTYPQEPILLERSHIAGQLAQLFTSTKIPSRSSRRSNTWSCRGAAAPSSIRMSHWAVDCVIATARIRPPPLEEGNL